MARRYTPSTRGKVISKRARTAAAAKPKTAKAAKKKTKAQLSRLRASRAPATSAAARAEERRLGARLKSIKRTKKAKKALHAGVKPAVRKAQEAVGKVVDKARKTLSAFAKAAKTTTRPARTQPDPGGAGRKGSPSAKANEWYAKRERRDAAAKTRKRLGGATGGAKPLTAKAEAAYYRGRAGKFVDPGSAGAPPKPTKKKVAKKKVAAKKPITVRHPDDGKLYKLSPKGDRWTLVPEARKKATNRTPDRPIQTAIGQERSMEKRLSGLKRQGKSGTAEFREITEKLKNLRRRRR